MTDSSSLSSKLIEKVFNFPPNESFAIALIKVESIPPDKKAPIGTSLIICESTTSLRIFNVLFFAEVLSNLIDRLLVSF